MSTDRLLDRLRAADPAPAATIADHGLFAQIVAGPGDPRLIRSAPTSHRLRKGARRFGLLGAAIVLTAAGGTAGAIGLGVFSHASPQALFKGNPAGQFPGSRHQTVNPRTIHRATTFTVPGVGRFEYWIALSQKGWLCNAIRQPDGTWADLSVNDKFQLGGPVPGCGGWSWRDAHGFAYYPATVPAPRHRVWRIAYGYAPTTGHPVAVRDRISGVTVPIGDGRYFAIVLPYCQGRGCNRPAPFAWFQLQTLDASGRVLVTDARDAGM
jgi:hypothetical protein